MTATTSTSPTWRTIKPPVSPAARPSAPRLLYLGRLKQYKRIEVVLDVLEASRARTLDIAARATTAPALEAEIDSPRSGATA
jgi:hypothetical protein